MDKMRTIAQETTPQIVLRNCSEEVGAWSVYNFSEEGYVQSSIHFDRMLLVTRLLLVTRGRCLLMILMFF